MPDVQLGINKVLPSFWGEVRKILTRGVAFELGFEIQAELYREKVDRQAQGIEMWKYGTVTEEQAARRFRSRVL